MIEYVKKSDVLEIINSPLPRDLTAEYIFDLKGVWLDEDEADTPQTDLSTEEFVEGMKNLKMEVKQTDCEVSR